MKTKLLTIIILLIGVMFIIECSDNPVEETNNAPTKPEINLPAGSPANTSTNQSITPTLSWNCTDPDSDKLTYDVYFGTNNNPSVVVSDKSIPSYSTGTLQYDTHYYWKIVAKDPKGASSTSDVWNFRTLSRIESVSKPTTISGNSSGNINTSICYNASGASSNLNHSLQYRFDWGDGILSNWGSSNQCHSYSTSGSYCIKAQARCTDHSSIVSTWSNCKNVTISEPINPTILITLDSLDFNASTSQQSITIQNIGTGTLTWSVSSQVGWITVNPSSGSTTTESDNVTITVDKSQIDCGSHKSYINITSNDTNPQIPVTVTKTESAELVISTSTLDFGTNFGGKGFDITNGNPSCDTLFWTAKEIGTIDWLDVEPSSGYTTTEEDNISVFVDRTGLSAGEYNAIVQVRTTNSGYHNINVTMQVACELTVTSPSLSSLWYIGDIETIQWSSGTGNVKIELYRGGVYRCLIVGSTPNDGLYDWEVTDCFSGTYDNHQIKISKLDDPSCFDFSSNFAMSDCNSEYLVYNTVDAHVIKSTPVTNFGNEKSLLVGTSGSDEARGFIKFDLGLLENNITISKATLRLRVEYKVGSPQLCLFQANGSWSESTINWNNAPYWSGGSSTCPSSTAPAVGQWWEIDVTSIVKNWVENNVTNNGFLLLIHDDDTEVYVGSSESSYRPALDIDYCPK